MTLLPTLPPRGATPDSDEHHIRTLTGHSGCLIELRLAGDFYFVRKRSASPAYNSRLRAQIAKQVALSALIATPRVYRQGEEDGLVWFDMEYIRGSGFVSYTSLQTVGQISAIVGQLAEPLHVLAGTSVGSIEPALFEGKLAELKRTVVANPLHLPHAGAVDRLLGRLAHSDWSAVPKSLCHGDLTVENMLMRENGIVFIDLLDGELESVWMDVAKLIHDLQSGWSLRSMLWSGKPDPTARLLHALSRYLAEELENRMDKLFPALRGRLDQLRALQALRVLPYVRSAAIFDNVLAGVQSLPSFRTNHDQAGHRHPPDRRPVHPVSRDAAEMDAYGPDRRADAGEIPRDRRRLA